ncbi:MAG: hypothetical protein QW692_02190 [Nitrososphaerota archaeon]
MARKLYVKKKVLKVLRDKRVIIRDEYGRIRTVKLRRAPALKSKSGHKVLGRLPSGELVYVRSDTGKVVVTSPYLDRLRQAWETSPPYRRFEGD